MYRYRWIISLLFTIFIITLFENVSYAQENQIVITKDKVITFNGPIVVYARDGRSKSYLEFDNESETCQVIGQFGKYVILYKWEGHQTDMVGLFDINTSECSWFYDGNVYDYVIQKDKMYLKLMPVIGGIDDIEYAFIDNKGVHMLDEIDTNIKFQTCESKQNTVCNVSQEYSTDLLQSTILNDKKFKKKYDNIDKLQCFQADNNNIYLIQKVSGYNAPPLSDFIVINRKSGKIKKQPIFVENTNSLQFYGGKLIFYGQGYYRGKDKEHKVMEASLFLINKDGKNITPLYKKDGVPFDVFNLTKLGMKDILKPGSKVSIPKYTRSNPKIKMGAVKVDKGDKLYLGGSVFENGNKAVGFFKMINSKTRFVIFDKGSKTGVIIQDGLPYDTIGYPSIVMNRFILFTDNKSHKCFYDMKTSQIKEISSSGQIEIRTLDNVQIPKNYITLYENCIDKNGKYYFMVSLYDMLTNNKAMISYTGNVTPWYFYKDYFYFENQEQDASYLNKIKVNGDTFGSIVNIAKSNGQQWRVETLSNKYLVCSAEKGLNILDLYEDKNMITIDGRADWRIKNNILYFLSYDNNTLKVGYLDTKNNDLKYILKKQFKLDSNYTLGWNGVSINVNDKTIEIVFCSKDSEKEPMKYSLTIDGTNFKQLK